MIIHKRCLKVASISTIILLLGIVFGFTKTNPAHALEAEAQNGDTLHSAILTYNDEVVDLYRCVYGNVPFFN